MAAPIAQLPAFQRLAERDLLQVGFVQFSSEAEAHLAVKQMHGQVPLLNLVLASLNAYAKQSVVLLWLGVLEKGSDQCIACPAIQKEREGRIDV